MFIIKTYVDKSEISGKGVFAGENIKKGKVVWIFNPKVDICLSFQKFNSLYDENLKNSIRKICFINNNMFIIPTDNDKYSNHSDTPNLVEDINDKNPISNCLIAAREILKGEELTQNYLEFMPEEEFKIKMSIDDA